MYRNHPKRFVQDPKPNRWILDPALGWRTDFRPIPRRLAPAPPKRVTFSGVEPHRRHYLLIKKIGEGGQGRCDLAERESDGMRVVLKSMKTPVESVRVRGMSMPKEIHIVKHLLGSHRRILEIFHWSAIPGETMFITQYCSLGDLNDLIKYHHHQLQRHVPEIFICT